MRLEVLDPEGAAGTAEASYPVTPNAAPVAMIASPVADGVYYSDQLVTFRGTVDDTEDAADALTAWWEDGDTRLEGINTSPSGSGEVLGYAQLGEGPHALELHVLDTAGNEGIATVIVDVGPPNTAPACVLTAPSDGGASAEGARVDFAGTVSDIDIPADRVSVRWSSDKDGDLGASSPDSAGSLAFSTSTLSVNTHRVTMTVTDEVGATCTTGLTWTVGTPPSVTLETPLPGEVANEGEGVTFRALVSDREDISDALLVRWEDDLGGVLYEGAPDSTGVSQFIVSDLAPGDHILTVTVTDTAGLRASTLGSYSVNGAPSAPTIRLTPASPTTIDDLSVVFDTASVDPEGDALTYTYTWLRDGVVSAASTSATLPASATTDGQTWTVEVEASDGLATSPLARASVRIANTAPTLASVTVSPDPAHRDDILTCTTGTTTDADGDTVTLSYAWTVDGIAAGTGATLTGPFLVGALVACTATPTDGKDTGASVSDSVTVTNTLPVVSSVSLTPSTVYTNDTLTANAVSSDADGDTVSLRYRWFMNGVELAGATASTLSGAAAGSFDRDDVVTVEVTPDDGAALGASVVSAGVTVRNTAPTTPTIAITPASPAAGDALTCSVVTPSTDVDGDTVSYSFAWDQDGTSYAGASSGGTSSTVAGADVGGGETWTCEVTAGDGAASSTVTSALVTAAFVCGDGTLDVGEACDDGNVVNGDGCDESCQLSWDLAASATPVFSNALDTTTGWTAPCYGGAAPAIVTGSVSALAWDFMGTHWGQRRTNVSSVRDASFVVEYYQRLDSTLSYGAYMRVGMYARCVAGSADVLEPAIGVDFSGGIMDLFKDSNHSRIIYTPAVATWKRVRLFVNDDFQVACMDDNVMVTATHDITGLRVQDIQLGVWHDPSIGGDHARFDEVRVYRAP